MENLFHDVIILKDDLIGKDILNQGGVVTPLQSTILNLASLKTLNCNLMGKGVSDHYKGTKKLSDDNLKVINSAIRDFQNKIKKILESK